MEIVYDADCKAVVMAIITKLTEVCPSAMAMEDIFNSLSHVSDPDKTSRLFFNAAQQNLTL